MSSRHPPSDVVLPQVALWRVRQGSTTMWSTTAWPTLQARQPRTTQCRTTQPRQSRFSGLICIIYNYCAAPHAAPRASRSYLDRKNYSGVDLGACHVRCQVLQALDEQLEAAGSSRNNILKVSSTPCLPYYFCHVPGTSLKQVVQLKASPSIQVSCVLQANVLLKDIAQGAEIFNAIWEQWIDPKHAPV